MAKLTTAQRNALPNSAFAGPNRSYPVQDASHARNALSRGAQFASPALQAKIKAKVGKKFPDMGSQSLANAVVKKRKKRAKQTPAAPKQAAY